MKADAPSRSQSQRVLRVVRGLRDPETRPAYVAAVRRRSPFRKIRTERCLVCRARGVRVRTVTSRKFPDRTFDLRTCPRCGHVGNPDNVHDYRRYESEAALPLRPRIGTPERLGREFHMGKMAVDILGGSNLDVLVFGAGRSHDNHHIAALDQVRHAALGDIMNVRPDADFVDLGAPVSRKFDIVVASEVVEHFLDPRPDFAHLLEYVRRDGLVVCSTNINEGLPLERANYLFISGHVSYYSPRSIELLAKANGFHIDFRVPWVATGYGGPRKRYVLMSRSRSVMESAVRYFGDHLYAPSESPHADVELAEKIREQKAAERARRRVAKA